MTKISWPTWLLLGIGSLLPACATVMKPIDLFDPVELQHAVQDATGGHHGLVWLKREILTRVDSSPASSRAQSTLTLHCALTRFGQLGAEQDIVVPILLPPGATLGSVQARTLGPQGIRSLSPTHMGPSTRLPLIDPNQQAWEFLFPPQEDGAVLEVLASFTVPGTLVADAHWLNAHGGPSLEVLLRYDVPKNTVSALQVKGGRARPVVTEQDGHTVMALYARNVEAFGKNPHYMRYATRSVNHRGTRTFYASSWKSLSSLYTDELLERSKALRRKHRAPMAPKGQSLEDASSTYLWVRDRLQRPDAMQVDWKAGQDLPHAITSNTLNGTDKVHLLHWLLSEAGIDHHVAAARSNRYPQVDAGFPSPEAFDRAIIYLDGPKLWLDPACQLCEMGEVRPEFQGGQGLLLPVQPGAAPIPITSP